jgi:hypothetical protein
MSAAKEIVIVEHSKERSLKASKGAGSNGSGQANGTRAAETDGPPAVRRRLPDERHSLTHHFSVGGQGGYVTVGLYEDDLPGELFIRMAKEGSTVSGLMDSFATAVSLALQYGVPLRVLCDKFSHTRFEPSGWSGNPKIGYAKSLTDYLFRWLSPPIGPPRGLTEPSATALTTRMRPTVVQFPFPLLLLAGNCGPQPDPVEPKCKDNHRPQLPAARAWFCTS